MSRRSIKFLPRIRSYSIKPASVNALLLYALTVFFLRFADATMAYISPVHIQAHLHSAWQMGLIISTSSAVGLICDIVFGEIFKHQKFNFFLFWGIICAVLFPLSFLFLPSVVPIFILSMSIWGVYFELFRFSDFSFINKFLDHQYHAVGWGILYAFIAASYMLAPPFAAYLLDINPDYPFYSAVISLIIALLFYLFITSVHSKRSRSSAQPPKHSHDFAHQLKLWQILVPTLWPVLLFSFTLTILDATFWTSGAILSEEFKTYGMPGGLIFFVYLSPALFMGTLAGKIARPFGKKKAAFSSGLLAGVFFTIAGIAHNPISFLIAVFLGSVFIAIAYPEINGTVEDYIDRLGHSANSMIGLGSSMSSLAFIIGPILAGFMASVFDHQLNFSVIGVLLVMVSLISLIKTPTKIRLPQQAIHRLEDALKQI